MVGTGEMEELKYLREKHADVLNDKTLNEVASQRDLNYSEDEIDEKEFVRKSEESLPVLLSKLEENSDDSQ
ncbi:MAG: hypothetical protein ABH951_00250 [Patescibacteria group bacterium]